MKRDARKRLNAKFQLNPITSYFDLFYIPKKIAIYVTGRQFLNLGLKRGCQKKVRCEISAESDFIFRHYFIRVEIAIYVTGGKFSN